MTPQQLKALLRVSKTADRSNDITTNNAEKLYNLKELGIYFKRDPYTVCRYIRHHKINYVISKKAKFGYHKYYRLSDLRNYKPSRYANVQSEMYIKNQHSDLTLFQRIKLLFGFDI